MSVIPNASEHVQQAAALRLGVENSIGREQGKPMSGRELNECIDGPLFSAHQVALSPHVVHELSLHVAAALPNAFLAEFIDWTPGDLFEGMPKCVDGAFRISDRAGHGITLSAEAEKKYRLR